MPILSQANSDMWPLRSVPVGRVVGDYGGFPPFANEGLLLFALCAVLLGFLFCFP